MNARPLFPSGSLSKQQTRQPIQYGLALLSIHRNCAEL